MKFIKSSSLFILAAAFVVTLSTIFSIFSYFFAIKAFLAIGIAFTVLGTLSSLWGSDIGVKSNSTLSIFSIAGLFMSAVNIPFLVLSICFVF